ncbi:MAG: 16S rRNA (guanine(966)-N(2))-methyltransferase RsmD [Ignavibacteriales bacterium]|nr:16S rRNA (guanine(966)-N(2))-methyltransferase RsmD [Ignavibacteriales bacterium]
MMRIIAGEYRGRILSSLSGLAVRPTTDRVRQTVFDILSTRMDFEGIRVLDLFSGSGSLGLEAVSRGAGTVTMVDNSRKSLAIAEKNARILGCASQCTFYQADVFWYLRNTRQEFDLVFADPPFKLDTIGEIPERTYESSVLKPGRYFVMEHGKSSTVGLNTGHFEIMKKTFGQTMVLIMKKFAWS